jgi:hypothetical protein
VLGFNIAVVMVAKKKEEVKKVEEEGKIEKDN